MTHLYVGTGKGKTTAALGLALRANGCGMKTYVALLLKDSKFPCHEASACKKLGITIERFHNQAHPLFNSSKISLTRTRESLQQALKKVIKNIIEDSYQLIIVDEVLNALEAGLIKQKDILHLIEICGKKELVLTGRSAPRAVVTAADYVSRITKVKHPFDRKVCARAGIEY